MNTSTKNLTNSALTQQYNDLTWQPLHQLNLYRLVLTIGFIVVFYKGEWMSFLGSQNPAAFLATTFIMLMVSLVYIFMGLKNKPGLETQVIITNASDILFITLLSHYSGGLSSSLSILLIINITATGTLLRDRDSFLFAALASMAILGEQTYSLVEGISPSTEYSRSGLLGLVFFGTSFLASILSKRARESEQLASKRGADIISLEILNEDIIQNMRTGIIVVDNDGHIRMANSSAEALLGHISLQAIPSLENILPALNTLFIEWKDQPNLHHSAIRQEQGLPDIQPGFRRLDRTGDTLIFLEDATQLNQRFQQIKLASLGRLTASIAHEIRNPLSAINHAAQLLSESQLDDADNKLTHIITTQVQRLDKVIQNVLQLSRQEQSSQETILLYNWLINFKQEFCPLHGLDDNQLQISVTPKDIMISFDSSHLHQVISNLATNAINHNNNQARAIQITISGGYDKEQHQPYLDIIDNGPGISPEQAQQIFDPFFTTHAKGTGLGLYISKEILESNRAKIRYIESGESGSCFRIQFLATANLNHKQLNNSE